MSWCKLTLHFSGMWRRMILLNEKTATSMSTALTMKGACVHRNSGTTLLPCRWCTRPLQQLHIYQTVRHHNPEDSNLVAHCCEGPKSRREKEHPLAPTFWNTKIKKYQGLQREKNCTVLYTTFCKMEGGQEGGGSTRSASPRQTSRLVYASAVHSDAARLTV
jgi:hypothetical protein